MITYNFIYPCEKCICCVIDLNSKEPYMCIIDGHYSGSPLSLSDNCPQNRKIEVEQVIK